MSRALIIHHGGRSGPEWMADEAEVLRATPILRVLADHEVTWYTSERAAPLLWGNPLIERVMAAPRRSLSTLARERFDLVLNLEATPGCCALADGIRARRHAGYTWDPLLGRARVRPTRALGLPLRGPAYQEWLFALIDRSWSHEGYVLGYRPQGRTRYAVGLNHAPTRAGGQVWPAYAWAALRVRLAGRMAISLPVSTGNLLDFVEWVQSCQTIITGAGLGLHVAMALGKRVVFLADAQEAAQTPLYGLGTAVTPPDGQSLEQIAPATIEAALDELSALRAAG